LKLGFYIRKTNLVIRNTFCNIAIIIQTFRTGAEKLFFLAQFSGDITRDIFIVFKPGAKTGDKNNP